MGMDKQKLLGKKSLTDFEKRWLADRNIEHPAMQSVDDVPQPHEVAEVGRTTADDSDPDGERWVGDTAQPYEQWTHADLQAEAGARGLTKSGTKAELVARLESDDADNE